jgi:hypothetical protein
MKEDNVDDADYCRDVIRRAQIFVANKLTSMYSKQFSGVSLS